MKRFSDIPGVNANVNTNHFVELVTYFLVDNGKDNVKAVIQRLLQAHFLVIRVDVWGNFTGAEAGARAGARARTGARAGAGAGAGAGARARAGAEAGARTGAGARGHAGRGIRLISTYVAAVGGCLFIAFIRAISTFIFCVGRDGT